MKLTGRRLSIMAACLLLVIAGGFAASVRSRFHPQVSSVRTTTSPLVSDNSIKPQSQQQGVTPQAVGPIDHYVIAGGGGTSTGDNLSVSGTVGEVSASNTQAGGSFSLNGGFWNTASATTAATPTPTPTPTPSGSPTPTPTPTATPPVNVVQFSSSTYSVQEDCTTLTITVTRAGDTSGAASVGYNTSDITATERKDYITALGRLQFAPGETSKSFVVLINEDSFVEGNETFNVNLSSPVG